MKAITIQIEYDGVDMRESDIFNAFVFSVWKIKSVTPIRKGAQTATAAIACPACGHSFVVNLPAQAALIKRLVEALNITAWYTDGYEDEAIVRCVCCDTPKDSKEHNCVVAAALRAAEEAERK